MSKKETVQPDESEYQITLTLARAAVLGMRMQERDTSYRLPTVAEAKYMKMSPGITFLGKIWTEEGWIYDPILDKVEEHPKLTDTATVHMVRNRK